MNNDDGSRPVHLLRKGARRSSCGTLITENRIDWELVSDSLLEGEGGLLATLDWQQVTCRRCPSTLQYHQAKEQAMTTETVGEPTQTRPTAEPLAGASLPQSNTFGEDEPLIHAATGSNNHTPLCSGAPFSNARGFSTMDGGAVNCRYCLNSEAFIERNNTFTEMMSPSFGEGEREPAATIHDREVEEDYGTPRFEHDCDACKFLGNVKGWDLYWCSQGGGPNISTVIARFSDSGPDYISGMGHARDNEMLALAVVRAFRAGLLNDTDLSWL